MKFFISVGPNVFVMRAPKNVDLHLHLLLLFILIYFALYCSLLHFVLKTGINEFYFGNCVSFLSVIALPPLFHFTNVVNVIAKCKFFHYHLHLWKIHDICASHVF
jgi:hypothetical protein